jgi:NADH-quinone oxidoreductase subunit E
MTVSEAIQDVPALIQEEKETVGDQVAEILKPYKGERSELIPILQRVQEKLGYLPKESMAQIARFLGMPESTVYGVTTFYPHFKLVPTGRTVIRICRGNACHARGGKRILKEVEKRLGIAPGESTEDLEYALESVPCLGLCSVSPVVVIGKDTHGHMNPKKLDEVLDSADSGEK